MKTEEIPPPPEKPDPNDCCGSGCVPCIYDYYYDQLEAWESKYGKQPKSKSQPQSEQ